MDIVERVKERIERKRSRKDRKREVWEMESWLIGTGRVVSKERKKPHP